MKKKILSLVKPLLITLVVIPIGFAYINATLYFNSDTNTLPLTNYGFAIFIGLASVFFSWSRSLDEKKHLTIVHRINKMAVQCIFGAVTFVLSSLLKYTALHMKKVNPDFGPNIFTTTYLTIVSSILISIALFCALDTLLDFATSLIKFRDSYYTKDAYEASKMIERAPKDLDTPKN